MYLSGGEMIHWGGGGGGDWGETEKTRTFLDGKSSGSVTNIMFCNNIDILRCKFFTIPNNITTVIFGCQSH